MYAAFSTMFVVLLVMLPGSFTALADQHHDMEQMDHAGHRGPNIHNSSVDGYGLAYHLINLRDKMKDMENMPEMQATHHMMVYIVSPDGTPLARAKVGYLVEGPDGSKQKLMAMGMQDGFGADVDFQAPGAYTVKTKAVANGTTLLDAFTYEVR
jgi:hypothetical protein